MSEKRRKLELHISSSTGIKTYTIEGKSGGFHKALELSEREWKALVDAHGRPPSVGDVFDIEIPGELDPEELI